MHMVVGCMQKYANCVCVGKLCVCMWVCVCIWVCMHMGVVCMHVCKLYIG